MEPSYTITLRALSGDSDIGEDRMGAGVRIERAKGTRVRKKVLLLC